MEKGVETTLKLKIPTLHEGQEVNIPKPKIIIKKARLDIGFESPLLLFTETVTLIFRRLAAEYNSPDLELLPNELFSLSINHQYLTKNGATGKILPTPTYYIRICKVMNKYYIKGENGFMLPPLIKDGKITAIRKMPHLP